MRLIKWGPFICYARIYQQSNTADTKVEPQMNNTP